MRNKLLFSVLVGSLLTATIGIGAKTVTMKGSDTMVILGQRWAEKYMTTHKDAVIQVTGGGSGTGIAALINGSADIAQSSRAMKDKEKEEKAGAASKPASRPTASAPSATRTRRASTRIRKG